MSIQSSPGTPASSSPSFAASGPNVRPGEKPPKLLPGTEVNNAVGATQFAMFWIQTLDWGYATTDSTLTKTYYAPSCKECRRFTDIIDSAKRAGDHFEGGRIVASKWLIADNDHRNGATRAVDVTYSQEAVKELDPHGNVVVSDPKASKIVRRLWLKWLADHWTVVDTRQVIYK